MIQSYPSVELTPHLWVPQRISYDMVGRTAKRNIATIRLSSGHLDQLLWPARRCLGAGVTPRVTSGREGHFSLIVFLDIPQDVTKNPQIGSPVAPLLRAGKPVLVLSPYSTYDDYSVLSRPPRSSSFTRRAGLRVHDPSPSGLALPVYKSSLRRVSWFLPIPIPIRT